MSATKKEINFLKEYLYEVLSGFMALNAMGRDRALGNLRWGEYTTAQKNRGILDDVDDMENLYYQDNNAESLTIYPHENSNSNSKKNNKRRTRKKFSSRS